MTERLGLLLWGAESTQLDIPQVQMSQFDIYGDHGCGIDLLGSLHRWGANDYGQANPLDGSFIHVSVGELNSCAIHTSGRIECWGIGARSLDLRPESTKVTVAYNHARAVSDQGVATCWGDNTKDKATVPDGMYLDVEAGESHTCVLRQSGRVSCVGSNNLPNWMSDKVFSTIAAGHSGTCGLVIDDTVPLGSHPQERHGRSHCH